MQDAEWSNLSERELVLKARAGSLRAFEELVFRNEARIFRFAAQYSYCEADAREITQDTFLKAFRGLDQFQAERSFGAWLFAIARHLQADWFRRVRTRQSAEAQVPEASTEENAVDQIARQEEHERIWDLARGILPQAQFEVLWLRYVEDLNVSEIAEAVRKSVPHVKILLFRARRNLRKALSSEVGMPNVWVAGKLNAAPERIA